MGRFDIALGKQAVVFEPSEKKDESAQIRVGVEPYLRVDPTSAGVYGYYGISGVTGYSGYTGFSGSTGLIGVNPEPKKPKPFSTLAEEAA